MRIAVTARGPGLDSEVDPRFGRAACFVVYDDATGAVEAVDNASAVGSAHGAGVKAAQLVADAGVSCVLTGDCGPRAYRALSAAGIAVWTGASGTVREALDAFREGRLESASGGAARGGVPDGGGR